MLLAVPFAAAEEQSQAPAQIPQAQTQAPVPPQTVPQPPGEAARFSFHRVGEAFVRLDSVTGQVAQCSQTPAGWTCTVAPDERTALDGEIARLQRENASLKKSLLARGDVPGPLAEANPGVKPVPPGNVPDPSPGTAKPPADLKLPTDAEVDRAIAYMKGVWRKLVDMMMDLQRDIQQRKG
ncbi:hypothetical protein [Rhodoplanes sp. Z2-YC6860]|uniref:hypothetical protein n=1 Tax=Rhodoplanes sp. Z2-YC6860 TaxID=674703 RepID=UPI0012EEB004|nr:hypothetical protein [Rhodoplanes sp. Z2-YC6860]